MNNPYLGSLAYKQENAGNFKGRDKDIENIYNILSAGECLTLYGASGVGKSSLLAAGLFPKLNANLMLPIKIVFAEDDFNNKDINFDDVILRQIDLAIKESKSFSGLHFERIHKENLYETLEQKSVWWRIHHCQLKEEHDVEILPVLVFDQFENMVKIPDTHWTNRFFSWLKDMMSNSTPNDIIKGINNLRGANSDEFPVLEREKRCKFIFTLRTDYLGLIEQWVFQKYFIKQLKENRYCLDLLTPKEAREVITGQEIDGVRYKKMDQYAEGILKSHPFNVSADKESIPCISPLLLSIICWELAKLNDKELAEKFNAQSQTENESVVNDIVSNFYDNIWQKLNIPQKVKWIIEKELVDDRGNRILVSLNNANLSAIDFTEKYLRPLEEERLIETIEIHDTLHVELVHDCFAAVADKSNKEQIERLSKKNTIKNEALGLLFALGITVFSFEYAYNAFHFLIHKNLWGQIFSGLLIFNLVLLPESISCFFRSTHKSIYNSILGIVTSVSALVIWEFALDAQWGKYKETVEKLWYEYSIYDVYYPETKVIAILIAVLIVVYAVISILSFKKQLYQKPLVRPNTFFINQHDPIVLNIYYFILLTYIIIKFNFGEPSYAYDINDNDFYPFLFQHFVTYLSGLIIYVFISLYHNLFYRDKKWNKIVSCIFIGAILYLVIVSNPHYLEPFETSLIWISCIILLVSCFLLIKDIPYWQRALNSLVICAVIFSYIYLSLGYIPYWRKDEKTIKIFACKTVRTSQNNKFGLRNAKSGKEILPVMFTFTSNLYGIVVNDSIKEKIRKECPEDKTPSIQFENDSILSLFSNDIIETNKYIIKIKKDTTLTKFDKKILDFDENFRQAIITFGQTGIMGENGEILGLNELCDLTRDSLYCVVERLPSLNSITKQQSFELIQIMSYYFYFQDLKYSLQNKHLSNYTYALYQEWHPILMTALYHSYKKDFIYSHYNLNMSINNENYYRCSLDELRKTVNTELMDYQHFLLSMIDMMYAMNDKQQKEELLTALSSYLTVLQTRTKDISYVYSNGDLSLEKLKKHVKLDKSYIEKSEEIVQILENAFTFESEYKDDVDMLINSLTKIIDTPDIGLYRSLLSDLCYKLILLQCSMYDEKISDNVNNYVNALMLPIKIQQDSIDTLRTRLNAKMNLINELLNYRQEARKGIEKSINLSKQTEGLADLVIMVDSLQRVQNKK